MTDRFLGLMCKPPRLGKSRLAAGIGAGPAARLAHAFLADSAALAAAVADRAGARRVAFAAPDETTDEVAALLPGWEVLAQGGGDLGARMERALAALFARGARRALLLGTDAPTLPPALLELALAHPAPAAVVPARDGGYCAVALGRPAPELFASIAWSTPAVLDQTRAAAGRAGVPLAELPPWFDVDEQADLPALRLSLAGVGPPGCSPLPPWRADTTRAAVGALSAG